MEAVAVGTEVLVAPGESVPLDGVVVTGDSAVDENMLTGGVGLGDKAGPVRGLVLACGLLPGGWSRWHGS